MNEKAIKYFIYDDKYDLKPMTGIKETAMNANVVTLNFEKEQYRYSVNDGPKPSIHDMIDAVSKDLLENIRENIVKSDINLYKEVPDFNGSSRYTISFNLYKHKSNLKDIVKENKKLTEENHIYKSNLENISDAIETSKLFIIVSISTILGKALLDIFGLTT